MKWARYDGTGRIVCVGECPDGMEMYQAQGDGALFVGDINPWDAIDPVTGSRIAREKPPISYAEARWQNYPGVAEQLDALWHAMDRGDIPRAPEFYQMIKSVKDAHPKPETAGSTDL